MKRIGMFVGMFLFGIAQCAESAEFMYFFNPDMAVNAKGLISAMTDFLKAAGVDAQFQPFLEYAVMEQQIKKNPPLLVLTPSFYAEQFNAAYAVTPVLIPEQGGKFTYNKAVVTFLDLQNLAELAGKTVASTSKSFVELLAQRANIPIDQLKFIPIKKDIDALLALQISKQVEAAIVTTSGIEKFTAINKAAEKQMKVLAEFTVGHPIFFVFKDKENSPDFPKVRDAFLHMHESQEGRAVLQLLHYDAWRQFTEEHRQLIWGQK